MNQRTYLKKWKLMLVQSILLVLLSIAFFIRPDRPLAGFQTPVGLLALLQGAIFILGFLFADPFDKSQGGTNSGLYLFSYRVAVFLVWYCSFEIGIGFSQGSSSFKKTINRFGVK